MANVSHTHFPVRNYDLATTFNSGQTFRWFPLENAWHGVIGHQQVRLESLHNGIHAQTHPATHDWSWLSHYLQLNVDLDQVIDSFPPNDPHLAAACQSCHGLRLLRQDPWECLASFILSSTKQITQIRQIVQLLCQRYGEPLAPFLSSPPNWSFPTPQTIAGLPEQALRDCKMGFRAPALLRVAQRIADRSFPLERLVHLPVAEARALLLDLPGVGDKIASCVLLFACGSPDAFPLDVWILRALRDLYFNRRNIPRAKLETFVRSHFGPNAGYAQQYLFHYMRVHRGSAFRNAPITT